MDPQVPTLDFTHAPADPPAPPEIPEKPKDNHWITILAMAVFVLLSLAAVAFLYYQNQQLKSMLASYQASPTPTASQAPNGDLANWKTFNGSDWSFKYPSALFAKVAEPNFVNLVDSETTPGSNARISVDARLIAPYLNDFVAASQRRTHDLNLINVQATPISNGVIITGTVGPGFGEGLKVTEGLIKYKGGAIALQYNDDNVDPQVFSQILSTFKFLGLTASPSASPIACTQEAKLCPNGSYVGRTGANCEFAPCPSP